MVQEDGRDGSGFSGGRWEVHSLGHGKHVVLRTGSTSRGGEREPGRESATCSVPRATTDPYVQFIPSYNCPHSVERIGNLGDGGKWICGAETLGPRGKDAVIYSIGACSFFRDTGAAAYQVRQASITRARSNRRCWTATLACRCTSLATRSSR